LASGPLGVLPDLARRRIGADEIGKGGLDRGILAHQRVENRHR